MKSVAFISGEPGVGHLRHFQRTLQYQSRLIAQQQADLERAHAELDATLQTCLDQFELAPVAFFSISRQGKLLEANRTGMKLMGLAAEDLHRHRFFRLVSPEYQPVLAEHLQRVLDRQARQRCELKMKRCDGSNFFAQLESIAGHDRNNGQPFVRTALIDISHRLKAETELRLSQRRLRQIIDLVPHLIFAKDYTGRYLLVNRAMAEAYGTTPQQLVGSAQVDYHPNSKELNRFLSDDRKVIDSGEPLFIREEPFTDRQGNRRLLNTIKIPYTQSGSATPAVVGVAVDVTERKQAEEALRQLNEELEKRVQERTEALTKVNSALAKSIAELQKAQNQLIEYEKMKALGELVAGVAHEINTPVGIGVTAASYLELKIKELACKFSDNTLTRNDLENCLKTAQETSSSLMTNLNRAADLVKNFKQVAVDQTSEEQRRFNLKEYLHKVLQSLHPQVKRTPHVITVDCPEDIVLYSYPGAFSQIITNLVMNSLIHGLDSDIKGTINLKVRIRDEQLVIDYQDNGKGIVSKNLGRVFDPFFTTRRSTESTGLGLHLVYNLATRLLSGQIECHSPADGGVRFTITIPTKELIR